MRIYFEISNFKHRDIVGEKTVLGNCNFTCAAKVFAAQGKIFRQRRIRLRRKTPVGKFCLIFIVDKGKLTIYYEEI